MVVVHCAAIKDRDGAGLVLDKRRRRFPWLDLIWAYDGYNPWRKARTQRLQRVAEATHPKRANAPSKSYPQSG